MKLRNRLKKVLRPNIVSNEDVIIRQLNELNDEIQEIKRLNHELAFRMSVIQGFIIKDEYLN